MQKKNEKWHRYINTDNVQGAEQTRQDMSLFAMIILAVFVLGGLLVSNHEKYSAFLNGSLASVLGIVIASALIFYLTPFKQPGRIILCIGVLGFNGCLIYSGGSENTALYWVMYYPLIVYSITGPRLGSVFSLAFVTLCITLLYGDNLIPAVYGQVEKSRFILSTLVIIVFSFINEFYRFRSHSIIESVSTDHKHDANTDALTNIPNRRFLESSYFPYLKTNSDVLLPASLIMADIDHFKMINDTYGHEVGDQAIIHAVNVIKKTLRNTDVLCRIGGEEFLICIPQMSLIKASKVAEKIRLSLQETPLVLDDGQVITIKSSFGVSDISSRDDFNTAIKVADDRLYAAKEQGRNRVVSS